MKKLLILLLVSFLWTVSCSPKPDIKKLTQQANQGNAHAQFNLGVMYANGEGVPQDDGQAVKWYRLAADQGDAKAQCTLGVMYGTGRGVPKDYVQAAKWSRLAADQGDAKAQSNLGLMYGTGRGVPQDDVQAHMWFNLAAAQGFAVGAKNRNLAAEQMTPQQIERAQELARNWKPKQ